MILLAQVGGAVVFLKTRNRRLRDEAALRTVRFMRAEPASDEQIKGSAQMVQNRMEADPQSASTDLAELGGERVDDGSGILGFFSGHAESCRACGTDGVMADPRARRTRNAGAGRKKIPSCPVCSG